MPVKTTKRRPATRKRRMTPEDLQRIVFVSDPQISPDGTTVLLSRKHSGKKNKYVTNLWTVEVDGGGPKQLTNGGKDSMGRWAPDGERIAFTRSAAHGPTQIYIIDAGGGEAVSLTSFGEGTIRDYKWSPDGQTLAVAYRETDPDWTEAAKKKREEKGLSTPPRVLDDIWYRLDGDGYFNAQRFHLYLVDVSTGKATRVYDKDTLGFFSYDWSPDSREIALTTNTDRRAIEKPEKDTIYRLNVRTKKLKEVPGLPPGPKDEVRWSPNGKQLAYAGRIGDDGSYSTENLHLFVCDPVKGKPRDLLSQYDLCMAAASISDTAQPAFGPVFCWGRDSRHILAQIGWHGEAQIVSIPLGRKDIESLTGGRVVHGLGNLARSGNRIALTIDTPTKPPEAYVGEIGPRGIETRQLTEFNSPWIKELTLSKPESHWVKTEDGTRVHTWVMLPPGRSKRGQLPAVLEIHGGPHGQYGLGFFHEFQVLAANGYAVFYSNPRGSKGYGRDHCAAIRGTWGTDDWTDIQAVTRFMKEQRWVDSKRMGVMGGSYGGYMTNWVIGHTREFAGAITDRCVSNLISMSGSSDFPGVPDRYWEGNFWDKVEPRWKSSPLQYLGNARTPTLIIHSEGDLRCNIEQAEQVFAVLKLKNVPTRFVRYPRSTFHGLSRGGPIDLRLHRLHQILDWWKKYLG